MRRKYQLRQLLTLIDRTERIQALSDYRLLGVRLAGNGPYHRETKKGVELSSTKLTKVKTGDFIYSRLFAWKGAFGIIEQKFNDHYVSNEFPIFQLKNNETCLEYLKYYFQQQKTWFIIEDKCQGSTPLTRNRFKVEDFLNLDIDLPNINIQKKVGKFMNYLYYKREQTEQLIEQQLQQTKQLLYSLYTDITQNVPTAPMKTIAPIVRRPVEVSIEGSYPELGVRSFGRGIFHKPTLQGADLTWQKLFHIHEEDVVISNIKAWEGAIAVANKNDHLRVASHRYITCVPKPNVIMPHFLSYHLLSPKGLEDVNLASPGSADRNRTLAMRRLEKIEVPIPPMKDQQHFDHIFQKVQAIRQRQKEVKKELGELFPAVLEEVFE